MPIDTELEKLIINKNISKSQFIEAYEKGLIGDNDLSFVNDNTEYDIIVDDFMSDTSENAVQNKVVKNYVDSVKKDINNQKTNCITEIPQDIKLEYSGKTVTLKSGSKVTVPNGSGVFNEITTSDDKSVSFSSGTASDVFVIYSVTSNALTYATASSAISGTDTSSVAGLWYNSSTNKVGFGSNNIQYSFPLALVSKDSDGNITKMEVFNGMGYIGSSIFYLKGLKGLAPNGRNTDGSLKNVEVVLDKPVVYTFSSSDSSDVATFGIRHDTKAFTWYTRWSYDEEENYNKVSSGIWKSLTLGTCTITSGVISNFKPKYTFRAVDSNELNLNTPTGVIFPFAGLTAPSGFLICDGSAISRTTYANLFKAIGTTYGSGDGSTTFNLPNYSSARFITSSTVSVKGDGKTLGLMGYSTSGATTYEGYGLIKSDHETWGKLIVASGAYGTTAGSSGTVTGNKPVNNTTLGLTNTASKSGIIGTASVASSCKFIIKY